MVMQALVNTVQRREPKSLQQTIQEAESYADSLLRGGLTRLAGVKHDLEAALGDSSMRVTIRVDGASSPDPISGPRSTYYRSQIIEIARIFDYYANLNGYKGWVRLSIRVPELQTEILLSFHGLGRDLSGVMMCSAFGYRRLPSEEGGESHIQGLQPLCEYPFQFSYQDQLTDLQVRFGKWLESSIILALEYWRRSL